MACKMFCILGLIFFGFSLGNARIFYVDGPSKNGANLRRTSQRYPTIYQNEMNELASRDLDMTFTAGESNEIPEDRSVVYPVKKNIYSYPEPEEQDFDVNRGYDRPVPYYKIIDVPRRKFFYDDQYPVSDRKVFKINGNEPRNNGRIVLDLRVIANNNNYNDDDI